MSLMLYVQASPLTGRSYSIQVAGEFVEAYRKANPGDRVNILNVFTADLPPFDSMAVSAKYAVMHGKPHTNEEENAWERVRNVVAEFREADKYLFAVPMWNFGIPYRLKQYLDLLLQPGLTFSFTHEEGYKGLVVGKPVTVVYARGSDYSAPGADAIDFQKRYMEHILRFMGFTDIRSIVVEPTMAGGHEAARDKRDAMIEVAEKMAVTF